MQELIESKIKLELKHQDLKLNLNGTICKQSLKSCFDDSIQDFKDFFTFEKQLNDHIIN